jgi:hypothetical protein
MTQTFTLPIGTGIELHLLAEDSGRTWNGYAVPILTDQQAATVGAAIGEADLQAGESDGLQWEIKSPCTFCGMPHSDEHSCELRPFGQ